MSGRSLTVLCAVALILLLAMFLWQAPAVNLAWSEYLILVQSVQRDLHLSLSGALRNIEADGFGASLALIGLSFLYGVFHAAGPGHGKIVISTYLLSHESQLRRGVILSFASALVQGLTAIVIVTLAVWLLNLSMRQTRGMANDVEVASFALITLMGLMIMASRLWQLRKAPPAEAISGQHEHKHEHKHDHAHGHCDHAHGPSQSDLDAALSLRTFIGIVLSIGIRPCSGAVIVLLLAYSLDLGMVGLFAVLAMSLGTAITVSVLASMSVYLREAAKRLLVMMPDGGAVTGRIMDIVGLIGGVVIFAFGASMLNIALFTPVHPFR
ncbi:MAG: nickel/cobalt transporter [Candidatus Puniceispirillum sp.]